MKKLKVIKKKIETLDEPWCDPEAGTCHDLEDVEDFIKAQFKKAAADLQEGLDAIPIYPRDYYYGVKIDQSVADPAVQRVGNPALHVSLPVQSRMRRCILKDDGTVAYYLHPTDSTKKADGTAAKLDGTDGMYMVEIPEHYAKFEVEGSTITALISEYPLPGFHKVRKIYRSAVEATIDRTNSSKPKLAAVCNTTAAFRGGDNDSSKDNLLGVPASAVSLIDFRTYARYRGEAGLNGAGWNCDLYEAQRTTYWLYVIEYANRNCQLPFNPQPDANGYKQGGLGEGVTDMNSTYWWNTYQNCPFIPCGTTNTLGNASGVIPYAILSGSAFQVPSYRGIENPFGHIWHWVDGCFYFFHTNKFYVYNNPVEFEHMTQSDSCLRGEIYSSECFISRILCGEYGEIVPTAGALGASSTTHFCDYYLKNDNVSMIPLRPLLFGGDASWNLSAGLMCMRADKQDNDSHETFGTRLCFIPES